MNAVRQSVPVFSCAGSARRVVEITTTLFEVFSVWHLYIFVHASVVLPLPLH